jgi:hypothetical protein
LVICYRKSGKTRPQNRGLLFLRQNSDNLLTSYCNAFIFFYLVFDSAIALKFPYVYSHLCKRLFLANQKLGIIQQNYFVVLLNVNQIMHSIVFALSFIVVSFVVQNPLEMSFGRRSDFCVRSDPLPVRSHPGVNAGVIRSGTSCQQKNKSPGILKGEKTRKVSNRNFLTNSIADDSSLGPRTPQRSHE